MRTVPDKWEPGERAALVKHRHNIIYNRVICAIKRTKLFLNFPIRVACPKFEHKP